MQEEGYISSYEVADGKVVGSKVLRISLKYVGERRERRPVISGLQRISRPGRRVYTNKQEIPWVLSGLGIAILSTPKGVMTGQRARQLGVGGEVLCRFGGGSGVSNWSHADYRAQRPEIDWAHRAVKGPRGELQRTFRLRWRVSLRMVS
jgi:small subunit ribosomal protein S8